MAKIALTFLIVVAVITVQGKPGQFDYGGGAGRSGSWDHVQDMVNKNLQKELALQPVSFDSVRSLKPEKGSHVYGEAQFSFNTATNINGETSAQSGGHKVVNDDGKVKEFDFTPNTEVSTHGLNNAPGLSSSVQDIPDLKNLLNNNFSYQNAAPLQPISFDGVRNLKPGQGSHVYGEAQYAFNTASNINGQTSSQSGGHKVVNNDGKVKEFDFTPSSEHFGFPLNNSPVVPILPKDTADLMSLLNKEFNFLNSAPLQPNNSPVVPLFDKNSPDFYLNSAPLQPVSFDNVRNLKPAGQGSHVYGEAQYSFNSASNINGKTSAAAGGHKVINHDGKVKEFDFTPSTEVSTLAVPKLF